MAMINNLKKYICTYVPLSQICAISGVVPESNSSILYFQKGYTFIIEIPKKEKKRCACVCVCGGGGGGRLGIPI